jgi:hypothetical protein
MNTKRFKALRDAIEPSRKQLEPFRQELAEALKRYTGPHYGKNAVEDRPINMLQLSVESLLQQLSSRAPQVLCNTHKPELKSAAIEQELAINRALKQMEFEQEHRLWVLSAIFLMGVMEVGLTVVDTVEVDGEELPVTEIFCEAIMFDDFVFDTTATKWDKTQVGFWGHKFRRSVEAAKNDKSYDKEARKHLKAMERPGNDDTASISKPNGPSSHGDSFHEMCEIWQVFVPQENEVVTFTCDSGMDIPLKTVKWRGPRRGPYHLVGFNPVLNNIMPLPPVANWLDLDDLENKLYSKLGRQASRQKTIGICDNAAVKDGQNIIKTSDGDVIAVGNPNGFKEASFGGVNQQTLGFALNVRSMADFVMGNLSAQMGLGASAGTLGQEKMIRQAANIRIGSMQGVLLTATEGVLRDIAFYMHHHPTIEYDLTLEIAEADIQLPIKWPYRDNGNGQEIDARMGDFDEYEISIQPYSMTDISPGERATLLRQIWREDILPAIQLGVQPDVFSYISHLAKYYDLPELREIVKQSEEAMDPQERTQRGGGPQPGKPNGNYTRENVSNGMSDRGMDQQRELMALAAGEGEGG